MNRNLVFCTVGPGPGTVPFRKEPGATWDLVEVLWHPEMIRDHKEGRYKTDADHVICETDRTKRKFACYADAWTQGGYSSAPGMMRQDYDAVLIADDDLTPVGCTWSDVFALFHKTGLNVAQPALAPGSTRISSAYVTHQKSCEWRSTDFVEVMMPIFAGPCIERLIPFFLDEKYGLGLEMLWRERFAPIGVLDATPVLHTRPLGSAHSMTGVDSHPWKQAEAFRLRHGLTNDHYYPVTTIERHPKLAPPVILTGNLRMGRGDAWSRDNLIIRQLAPDREPWGHVAGRTWDLVELYFDSDQALRASGCSTVPPSGADVIVLDACRTRRKLATVKWLYEQHPNWFDNRTAIALIDDDVPPVDCTWDRIFDLFLETGAAYGQPALHASSAAITHYVTRQVRHLKWRWTDFVEVMCPIFTPEALAKVVHLFDATESGWAIDDGWSHRLGEGVILDATPVCHDRKLGTSYSTQKASEEANMWREAARVPCSHKVTLRHGPRAEGVKAAVCWACLENPVVVVIGSVSLCAACLALGARRRWG